MLHRQTQRSIGYVLVALSLSGLPLLSQERPPTDTRPAPSATEGVPILKDLPLLGTMFRALEPVWHPLEDTDLDPADDEAAARPTDLGYRERWLVAALKKAFPTIERADVVEELTTRFGPKLKTTHRRRGLEAQCPAGTVAPVREFLSAWDRVQHRQVTVEVRVLKVPVDPAREKSHGGNVALVDRKAFEQRLRDLRRTDEHPEISFPSLSMNNGQRFSKFVGERLSYVKDFDVEMAQGSVIADPIIGVIEEGVLVDVCPVVHPDGKTISVEAKVRVTCVRRPMDHAELKVLGGVFTGKSVTIDTPDVATSRWDASDVVIAGAFEGFVVEGLAYYEPGRNWAESGPPFGLEFWFLVHASADATPTTGPVGTVLGADPPHLFVRWPEAAVAERAHA